MRASNPADSVRLQAVDACRQIAAEIWSGERAHRADAVSGLNSEHALRERLRGLLEALREGLSAEAQAALREIDIAEDDPLAVRDKTETLVLVALSGRYDVDTLADASDPTIQRLVSLLVVQCLGGRLGRWATGDLELEDARIGRAVGRRGTPSAPASTGPSLDAQFPDGQHETMISQLVAADRVARTADGLFRLSLCFYKSGEYETALWSIRACLLEDLEDFSPELLLDAQRVESSLRALVERGRDSYDPQALLRNLPEEAVVVMTIDRIAVTTFGGTR